MVLIPSGTFQFGIDPEKTRAFFNLPQSSGSNAQPINNIILKSFWIDKFEVTYKDYMRFKPSGKYKVDSIMEPVRGVNWYEADAYCLWLGKRLPTEVEWEKAARGTDGRLFTWGNDFQSDNANLGSRVLPPDPSTKDISPFNVFNMNGNLAEWTASWYQAYPDSKYKDPNYGKKFKVTRGAAIRKTDHGFMKEFAMIPFRNFAPPHLRFWDTGFRCAKSI
jgi:formylglycine-generating enzyme required for sulfatase activity